MLRKMKLFDHKKEDEAHHVQKNVLITDEVTLIHLQFDKFKDMFDF